MHEVLKHYEAEPLTVPVSPNFEAAMGYFGPARFVGLYWEMDDFRIADGLCSISGIWHAWKMFSGHHRAHMIFEGLERRGICLGNIDVDATHWIVLDREARELYVLPVEDARQVLAKQHPTRDEWNLPLDMDTPEFRELLAKAQEYVAKASTHPDDVGLGPEQAMLLLQREKDRVKELLHWMDRN